LAKKKKSGRKGGYRKGKRKGTRHAKKLPLALTAGAALTGYALLAPVYTQVKAKSYTQATSTAKTQMTNWSLYAPAVGGLVISVVAEKVGVNKYIGRIPLIGKKVKM